MKAHAIAAAGAALAITIPASAPGQTADHRAELRPCRTPACVQRVRARRAHQAAVHRAHARARAVAHMRAVTRPYRGWLASTRWCESTNRYYADTGNGFYGAYQFTLRSWWAVGGRGNPARAAALEQDYRAVLLLRLQGAGAWPVCGH